jgi:NitT/TauT family transport system permease protein
MLGARNIDIMVKILLPGAARWLITGLRINIGIAILGAFIGEFVSSQSGLGHYIIQAGQVYDIPAALFGLCNLCAVALGLDILARKLMPKN